MRTIVVHGPGGAPVGIFTLVDLLRRVVLPGRPLSTPIAEVMSAPVVTLPSDGDRLRSDADDGRARRPAGRSSSTERRVAGVVYERDLFSLQRVSMRQVTEDLRSATSLDGLKRGSDDIRRLTQNLLAQGVAPSR